jgi:phosphoribosyl 1,2-cyclic phosphodiesterase
MDTEIATMRVSVLSSGSAGNVTYIETPQHKVLLDAGLSGIKIERLLHSINRKMADVDMLLVSHEHIDHSKAVGILARRYPQLSVYANQKTWDAMAETIGDVSFQQKNIFPPNTTLMFGDLMIESFTVSHDAAQAQFYDFHYQTQSFVVVSDTGYLSERILDVIQNANAYVLECNHDVEMLRNGDYPWSLKQRIMSDEGHLSNTDGALALSECIGPRTNRVFIGHRSEHNNTKDLAHTVVANILLEKQLGVDTDFKLLDTDVEKASKIFSL